MIKLDVKWNQKICSCVFLLLAFFGYAIPAAAQDDYIKVIVETPGTLMGKVQDLEVSRINSLALEGTLNSADLEYISGMSGKIATVRNLDLSNVKIAADEKLYKTYVLSDYFGVVVGNKVMKFYLSDKPRVETETQDIGALGGMNIIVSVYGNNLAGLFAGNTTLEKVILPSFVKEIGSATFYECTSINNVEIPSGVTEIYDRAFYKANSLSSISLPENLRSIGEKAFEGTSLTSVTLPSSVEALGDEAFYELTSLRKINLSEVSYIGDRCFYMCGLEGAIDLSSLNDLREEAFKDNYALNEVKFSENLHSIGNNAFERSGLISVNFPEGLKCIGEGSFSFCYYLTSVTMPSSLNDIGKDAFIGTPWENNLKGENGVKYINDIAYKYDYKSVTDEKVLTFKEGTSVIGSSFTVDYVRIGSDRESYAHDVITKINFPSSLKRIEGCKQSGNSTFPLTSKCDIKLPEGLEYIGNGAFCRSAISFDAIPESVTYIGDEAFAGCKNILELSLGLSTDSIYIGNYAFRGCNNISEINLGNSITYLGEGCFSGCKVLSEIKYNCNPDSIGVDVFEGTSGLYRVRIGSDVVLLTESMFRNSGVSKLVFEGNRKSPLSIERRCFDFCYNLESVTLPEMDCLSGFNNCDKLTGIIVDGNCNIIADPVSGSKNIESITVKGKVSKIGNNAFGSPGGINGNVSTPTWSSNLKRFFAQQCDTVGFGAFYLNRQLESVDIPDGVSHASGYAFYGCESLKNFLFRADMSFEKHSFANTALTQVEIGDWCKSVPECAFSGCESLYSVKLSPSVIKIEDSAFGGCLKLKKFDFKNIRSIGNNSFSNAGLSEIDLPDEFSELGESAFYCVPARNVSLPASLKDIPANAFMGTSGANFNWRVSDGSVVVQCSEIGKLAFSDYIGNDEFTVPEGIKKINGYAFGKGKFKTVSLPSTLKSLEATAFYLCNELQDIYCNAAVPPTVTEAFESIPGHILSTFNGTVYVPAGSVQAYINSDFWSRFNIEPISVMVESIKLNYSEIMMKPGDMLRIEAEVTPVNATNRQLKWYSTDEKVAEVDMSGYVKALNPGKAKIFAETTDGSGLYASCEVTVDKTDSIELSETGSMKVTVDGHDLIVECDCAISVVNMSGITVYSGAATRIESLQSGIYFVKSCDGTCKVMVN